MTAPPEPVFAEPWHAQLFALTVHLNETGRFTWADWASRFGARLAGDPGDPAGRRRHGHGR